jgi:hypothetical protein
MKSTDLHKKITEIENDLAARRHKLSPAVIEQIEDRIANLTVQFVAAVDRETRQTQAENIAKTLSDFDKNN